MWDFTNMKKPGAGREGRGEAGWAAKGDRSPASPGWPGPWHGPGMWVESEDLFRPHVIAALTNIRGQEKGTGQGEVLRTERKGVRGRGEAAWGSAWFTRNLGTMVRSVRNGPWDAQTRLLTAQRVN